jgi:hypothetical protein
MNSNEPHIIYDLDQMRTFIILEASEQPKGSTILKGWSKTNQQFIIVSDYSMAAERCASDLKVNPISRRKKEIACKPETFTVWRRVATPNYLITLLSSCHDRFHRAALFPPLCALAHQQMEDQNGRTVRWHIRI